MQVVVNLVNGALIGIANIIPGVSGGTLALMLGIYQRTINALGRIDGALIKDALAVLTCRKGTWRKFWRHVAEADLWFLAWLGLGAVGAIVVTSRFMEWLLDKHYQIAFGFFGGLVLASVWFPWRYLTRRSWRELVSALLAVVLTVGLSLSVSAEDKREKAERKLAMEQVQEQTAVGEAVAPPVEVTRYLFIFVAAVLAISAMVLPGVSGSFILLLLGVYFEILTAINDRDLVVLAIFMAGVVGGLLFFSRFMGFLLKRYFNLTMAFMIGLMFGSLYELWPFKASEVIGGERVFLENVAPGPTVGVMMAAVVAAVIGFLLVAGFAWLGRNDAKSFAHA